MFVIKTCRLNLAFGAWCFGTSDQWYWQYWLFSCGGTTKDKTVRVRSKKSPLGHNEGLRVWPTYRRSSSETMCDWFMISPTGVVEVIKSITLRGSSVCLKYSDSRGLESEGRSYGVNEYVAPSMPAFSLESRKLFSMLVLTCFPTDKGNWTYSSKSGAAVINLILWNLIHSLLKSWARHQSFYIPEQVKGDLLSMNLHAWIMKMIFVLFKSQLVSLRYQLIRLFINVTQWKAVLLLTSFDFNFDYIDLNIINASSLFRVTYC